MGERPDLAQQTNGHRENQGARTVLICSLPFKNCNWLVILILVFACDVVCYSVNIVHYNSHAPGKH